MNNFLSNLTLCMIILKYCNYVYMKLMIMFPAIIYINAYDFKPY